MKATSHPTASPRFGYRGRRSVAEALRSFFYLHTESGNIWSHTLGLLLFLWLGVDANAGWLANAGAFDRALFFLFDAAICAQMVASVLFHTFGYLSPRAYSLFARADYACIAFLIVSSYVQPTYYYFYCHPSLALLYTTAIVVLGVAATVLSFSRRFSRAEYTKVRALVFLGIALLAMLMLPNWWAVMPDALISLYMPLLARQILSGAFYIVGVVIYVSRFPEACCSAMLVAPQGQRLSYVVCSHSVWHLAVVAGAYAHYEVEHYAYTAIRPMLLKNDVCETAFFK